MSFATRKGGEYQDFDFSMGSYATYSAQGAMGVKLGQVQINGALQGYESDGWRENSRYTKMNAPSAPPTKSTRPVKASLARLVIEKFSTCPLSRGGKGEEER